MDRAANEYLVLRGVGVDSVNGNPQPNHSCRQRLYRRVVRQLHPRQRLAKVLAAEQTHH